MKDFAEGRKLRISIRACCMFEALAHKSFYKCNADDSIVLAYAVYCSSPDIDKVSMDVFMRLLENERFSRWIINSIQANEAFEGQFSADKEDKEDDEEEPMISDIAGMMIAEGMSPEYVMDKMSLWEMRMMVKGIEERKKERYVMDRLWTYLGILPQLSKEGARKLKTPDKLFQFPWEIEDRKKKNDKEFDEIKDKMLAFFNNQEAKMSVPSKAKTVPKPSLSGNESDEEYRDRIGTTYREISQFNKE